MIECNCLCETCKHHRDCELLLPSHESLRKVNNNISTQLLKLTKINTSIHHSLQNTRKDYPIYIGADLQELHLQKENVETQLDKLFTRKEDIIRILKKRV